MTKRNSWLALGLILSMSACAGCDGGIKGEPVAGTVTLDGQPLAEAHLIFYPVDADPAKPTRFIGLTDQQGHFVIRSDDSESEGVPPGKYRVTLTTAVAKPTDDETTPLPPERVPLKYRNNSLEFEVPQGGTREANFDLKSR